jgi:hypothetical protein
MGSMVPCGCSVTLRMKSRVLKIKEDWIHARRADNEERAMALVQCHECGHQISSTATTCPSCGAKQGSATRGSVWIVLGVLLLIGFVASNLFGRRPRELPPYEVVGSQGMVHFVVPKTGSANRTGLESIVREICSGLSHCQVMFWLDSASAARSLPMTDAQVNSTYAVYNINTSTGLDEFTCHPFGDPGERCATIE